MHQRSSSRNASDSRAAAAHASSRPRSHSACVSPTRRFTYLARTPRKERLCSGGMKSMWTHPSRRAAMPASQAQSPVGLESPSQSQPAPSTQPCWPSYDSRSEIGIDGICVNKILSVPLPRNERLTNSQQEFTLIGIGVTVWHEGVGHGRDTAAQRESWRHGRSRPWPAPVCRVRYARRWLGGIGRVQLTVGFTTGSSRPRQQNPPPGRPPSPASPRHRRKSWQRTSPSDRPR